MILKYKTNTQYSKFQIPNSKFQNPISTKASLVLTLHAPSLLCVLETVHILLVG